MITPVQVKDGIFACPKCGTAFDKGDAKKSKNAVRMHYMRVHTRPGKEGAMWKAKSIKNKSLTEHDRIKMRAYKATVRARNIARGLTSAGKPWKRKRPVTTGNNKWTPERRAKFSQTWNNKMKQQEPKQPGPVRGHIDYCPNCGSSLKQYELAAGFMMIK